MAEPNENSNTTDATPNVADQAPIIQMSAADLEGAVKSLIAQMAPAAQSGQGGLVVQISADQLKQAVRDTIIEMQQNAAASSKTAILDAITFPIRCLSDWGCWLVHGDGPDGGKANFGRPAGQKRWPQAQATQPSSQS